MRTKYLFALYFILYICPSALHAQVGEARRDLAVGVNGSYLLNKVSFNPTIRQTFKGGAGFGLTARYTCEKYFNMICALQMELNYSQLGWKEEFEEGDERTYERRMNYLQIPLLANLGFGRERGGFKGFLILGPQLNFFLGESDSRTGDWESERKLYEQSLGSTGSTQSIRIMQHWIAAEKKFEYGLTGGLGLEASTRGGHRFLLEGRYYFALSDIFHNTKQDPFGRSANGTIVAKVSYLFDVIRTTRSAKSVK